MKKRIQIFLKIAPVVFLLDQVSKGLVSHFLHEGARIPLIPGIFDLIHTRNPGAAFGTFSSLPEPIRLPFFYITSSIALILLLVYFLRLREEASVTYIDLSLILGGAIGNITDRFFRGEVVDFLSIHWYDQWGRIHVGSAEWHFPLEWPAFNVADAAITVGVFHLIWRMLRKG